MSNWYERNVLPKLIDTACGQKPMMALRERYVPEASGEVLEIGIGSGHNLQFYGNEVKSITGIDPSAELNETARKRAETLTCPVNVLGLSGEDVPIDNNQFDTVVCTWTMCTIPNPYRAVDEMRRVLKPGGKLIFIEHGLANEPSVTRWQRALEPVWKKIGGGCHLTRRADRLLEGGGFKLTRFESGFEEGPKFAAFMMHGIAQPV